MKFLVPKPLTGFSRRTKRHRVSYCVPSLKILQVIQNTSMELEMMWKEFLLTHIETLSRRFIG